MFSFIKRRSVETYDEDSIEIDNLKKKVEELFVRVAYIEANIEDLRK